MRLVQQQPSKARRKTISCPTQIQDLKTLDIRGVKVQYDCNSMKLWELENGEMAPKPEVGMHKPQVPLSCSTACTYLILNVAHGCNLKCTYCFASTYNRTPVMSPALAQEVVTKMFRPRDPIKMGFFGGEPLMAWDTIVSTVEFVKQLAKAREVKYSFHVTTNGTLLDKKKAKFLADNNFSVLVSVDGPEALHNETRPMKNGDNSFEHTMEGLEHLRACHARSVALRGSFTPSNMQLLKRVKFAQNLVDKGYAKSYSIEPVSGSEGNVPGKEYRFTREGLEKEFGQVSKWFLERLEAGKKTPFFYYTKLLNRVMFRAPQVTECGAGKGYLTVNPVGEIFACHREEGTHIGHIRLGIDEQLRLPWLENRIFRSAECMKCWARYICGGGCRQIKAERGISLNSPDTERCQIMTTIARECLWIAASMSSAAAAKYGGNPH